MKSAVVFFAGFESGSVEARQTLFEIG